MNGHAVDGYEEAWNRIGDEDENVRDALDRLLETAERLGLAPRARKMGREFGFRFGEQAYPLCRVNRRKGIAFHANRKDPAHIIRAAGDRSFRIAEGVLRRLALAQSL